MVSIPVGNVADSSRTESGGSRTGPLRTRRDPVLRIRNIPLVVVFVVEVPVGIL